MKFLPFYFQYQCVNLACLCIFSICINVIYSQIKCSQMLAALSSFPSSTSHGLAINKSRGYLKLRLLYVHFVSNCLMPKHQEGPISLVIIRSEAHCNLRVFMEVSTVLEKGQIEIGQKSDEDSKAQHVLFTCKASRPSTTIFFRFLSSFSPSRLTVFVVKLIFSQSVQRRVLQHCNKHTKTDSRDA